MDDRALLVFGCGVSFLAISGAYVFVRARYLFAETSGAGRTQDVTPALAARRVEPAERG